MKIVNRNTFLKLPANTLFSKYDPHYFYEFSIKGETLGNDFTATHDIQSAIKCSGSDDFENKLDRTKNTGESLEMDFYTIGRDGCFDDDQLFAVFDEADIINLMERLLTCVAVQVFARTQPEVSLQS